MRPNNSPKLLMIAEGCEFTVFKSVDVCGSECRTTGNGVSHINLPRSECRQLLLSMTMLLLLHFSLGIAKRNVLWPRPSVCMSVCLSLAAFLHYCTDPTVTSGIVGGAP